MQPPSVKSTSEVVLVGKQSTHILHPRLINHTEFDTAGFHVHDTIYNYFSEHFGNVESIPDPKPYYKVQQSYRKRIQEGF